MTNRCFCIRYERDKKFQVFFQFDEYPFQLLSTFAKKGILFLVQKLNLSIGVPVKKNVYSINVKLGEGEDVEFAWNHRNREETMRAVEKYFCTALDQRYISSRTSCCTRFSPVQTAE